MTKDYFVFGEYDESFPSKYIFVPSNYNEESTKHQIVLDESTLITYNDSSLTKEQKEAIDYYSDLFYLLDHSYRIDNLKKDDPRYDILMNSLYYYINDKNRFLDENQLHEKIKSMKEFEGEKINVVGCILMVHSCDKTSNNKYVLRFFSEEKNADTECKTIDDVINSLMEKKGISNVTIARNDENNKYCGYGYVWFNDEESLHEYAGKTINISGINMMFDD